MDNPLWKLEDVTLSGGVLPRLAGVTVEIGPGITAVLGPSGAGKTSLLNLLVAFESADEGHLTQAIETGGHAVPVYWVPQDAGLWPHLKVREHLERVLPPHVAVDSDEVDVMLAAFDLSDKSQSYPDELSQGQRSRLSVARALLADAAVLVMDEPLAHVDTAQAIRYWEVIRDHLKRTGASLVFATHLPKTVLSEADRVICLREGGLLFEGEVEALYRRPASRELAECLGECNWLEPEETRLWLGEERTGPVCIRPEELSIGPSTNGRIVVTSSRFKGGVAEVELEHTEGGTRRRFYHRPARDALRAGDRVALKAVLCLLFALVLAGCPRSEPVFSVREVHHWSMPPDGAMIPQPRTIGIGHGDEVIVLDTRGRVLVFDQNGSLLRQWRMPDTELGNPEGVCLLADGRIAVADTHYQRILLFDREGNEVGRFGSLGKEPGQFIYPVAVVQDDKGVLYVCEYGGNDRVQKFTPEGKFIAAFGSFGTGDDEFQRPSGMVWHEGKLYIADAINNRIQVFTDDGSFAGTLGKNGNPLSLHFPYDLALGSDRALYVVEYGAGRVSKVTLDGKLLGRFGTRGIGAGQFRTPWGIAIDSKLRLRVADTGNRRIVELKL